MSVLKEQFAAECPPLVIDGVTLNAVLYDNVDGRRHVYFGNPGERVDDIQPRKNATRIGYRRNDSGTRFLGMYVSTRLRGNHLGNRLVDYFLRDQMGEGMPAIETGTIHKPVIALALERAGLEAVSDDCLVEILPPSKYHDSTVPKVAVIRDEAPASDRIDRSEGGQFFQVVPPDELAVTYPFVTNGPVVALHTRYLP